MYWWQQFSERSAAALSDVAAVALRLLPAETAHDLSISLLRSGIADRLLPSGSDQRLPGLRVTVPGIGELSHPVGLAAGYDKNCRVPKHLSRLGFSFLEVGTVTPLPQAGNPRPRIFRLREQEAIINRLGFNSDGYVTVADRLRKLSWDHDALPLGVNLGKNAQTTDDLAVEDYFRGLETFYDLARYLVVNISSPNTPGLRGLANPDFIALLRERMAGRSARVWIKLDPDMLRAEFQKVIEAILAAGFQGLILTNTHRVIFPEVGGISGHPLAVLSARALEWAYEVHRGTLPMIANGGILSGIDIVEKLARGASAVQIYTAMVYRGPLVVMKLLTEVAQELKIRGFSCVEDVIGSYYRDSA